MLIALLVMGVDLGWYAVGRVIAPGRAVRVYANPRASLPAAPAAGPLKLLTYNICHGRGEDANLWPSRHRVDMLRRLDAIAAFLHTEAPDLVVLNEVSFCSTRAGRLDQARYLAEQAGFPYWVEQRNIDARSLFSWSEQYGNAVLSRHPLRGARLVPLPGYQRWEMIVAGRPQAVLCEVEVAPDRPIRLLATHLEPRSGAVRVASARILERCRQESASPFFVAGDLNTAPTGFPLRRPEGAETAVDVLLAGGALHALPAASPRPEDLTYSVKDRAVCIDWILVPTAWRIERRRVVAEGSSDHCAVVVEVRPLPTRN